MAFWGPEVEWHERDVVVPAFRLPRLGPEQTVAYRILNASQHSLAILTYDHVLERARRMLSIDTPSDEGPENESGIPF